MPDGFFPEVFEQLFSVSSARLSPALSHVATFFLQTRLRVIRFSVSSYWDSAQMSGMRCVQTYCRRDYHPVTPSLSHVIMSIIIHPSLQAPHCL